MAGTGNAAPLRRYTVTAMVLHWLIALAVILMLASGLVMTRVGEGALAFTLYQSHKALGLTVLVLTLARIGWRLLNPPPPLPDGMPRLERLGAHLGHAGLYGLMLALPLTGWAMVSWSPLNIPTTWFGLVEVPHWPGPADAAARAVLEARMVIVHELAGWLMLLLVVVHVAAALRHALILRDGVMARMLPAHPPTVRQTGVVLAGFAGMGLLIALAGQGPGEGAPPQGAAMVPAPAGSGWVVDHGQSRLGFRGTQLGSSFEGRFDRFDASIDFDPDTATGTVRVTVDIASAATGDSQRDSAMPGADWFDVASHPTALFEATRFRRTGEGAFEADATLTLRGISHPLTLPFTLVEENGATRARGAVTLVRTDFGVGQGQWASGNWVGLDVEVTVDLLARRP